MKVKLLWMILLLALPCGALGRRLKPEVEHAMTFGAEAKICLKICDDTGGVVSNASVRAVFDMLPRPHSVYGKTDTNGICVVKGKTNGNKIVLFVGKDGYYGSRKEISYVPMRVERDVIDDKWQPYGDVETVELRKIRSPAQLSTAFMRDFNYTKAINEWVGFDFEKRDFVCPHGKGVIADFEVFFEWDGRTFADYRGMAMKIRFVTKFSGYYQCEKNVVSEFKGPYSALSDALYQQNAAFSEHVIIDPDAYGRRYERTFFDESKCWVVRSRCKVDAEGNLESANYLVINNIEFGYDRGGIACVCITGAFNPTPNDTNLEDEEIAKQSRHFIRQCEPKRQ